MTKAVKNRIIRCWRREVFELLTRYPQATHTVSPSYSHLLTDLLKIGSSTEQQLSSAAARKLIQHATADIWAATRLGWGGAKRVTTTRKYAGHFLIQAAFGCGQRIAAAQKRHFMAEASPKILDKTAAGTPQ